MTAADAVARLAEANTRGDRAAVAALLAPDAILRSPVTGSSTIDGPQAIADLLGVVRAGQQELEYTDLLSDGDVGVQLVRVRLPRAELQGALVLRVGEDGLIREITVFFRPLPALAALTSDLGASLAARRSRGLARVVRWSLRPLLAGTRLNERVAPWLLRRARLGG